MSFFEKIKEKFYTSPELSKVEVELKKEFLGLLENIQSSILKKEEIKIKWNEDLDKSMKELILAKEILKSIENSENKKTIDRLTHRINQFIEKAKNPVYEIAFVGAVKAGKSTLINAILSKSLASDTEVTPETAALTKFRASKEKKDYIKVTFYREDEWDVLWNSAVNSKAEVFLEDFKKLDAENQKSQWINKESKIVFSESLEELKNNILTYTSSRSATHYFVKEVEVGLKDFNIPEQVCFVDTPGLDDVVDFRSNITRQYIDSANAVIVCVKSDSLRSDELLTISRVFANTRNNPEKVFVVGTQVDSLNNPKDDWNKQKDEWIKYLKGKSCYDSLELAQKNLIGTSAKPYNLAVRYEKLQEDEKEELLTYCIKRGVKILEFSDIISEDRFEKLTIKLKDIKSISNVLNLRGIIEKELLAEYNQNLLADFTNKYSSIKNEIDEYAKNQIVSIEEFIKLSSEDIETIKLSRSKKMKELEEIESKKKELSMYLNTLKVHVQETSKQLAKDIESIGNQL
ncbi:dynamin family protein [Cetobacterium sp.]|uniref:dynamin family protein n=1 Tax=Cetobacterium sp. TaxID=2071632 RepID=UPI003F3F692C